MINNNNNYIGAGGLKTALNNERWEMGVGIKLRGEQIEKGRKEKSSKNNNNNNNKSSIDQRSGRERREREMSDWNHDSRKINSASD